MNTVLLIDDDKEFVSVLADKFRKHGWGTVTINSIETLQNKLEDAPTFTHCVLDLNLNGQSGLRTITLIHQHSPDCKIVILTAFASIKTSIEAIKLGVTYVLSKPSRLSEIIHAFEHQPDSDAVRLDDMAQNSLDTIHREVIQRALSDHDYNISQTAKALGIDRRTLQRKIKRLSL